MKSITTALFLVNFFMVSVMYAADADIIPFAADVHKSEEARSVAQEHFVETSNELAALQFKLHATRAELQKLSQYLVHIVQPAELVADVHAEIVDQKTSPEIISAIGIEAAKIVEEALIESDRNCRLVISRVAFLQPRSPHVIILQHVRRQEIAAHAGGRIFRGIAQSLK